MNNTMSKLCNKSIRQVDNERNEKDIFGFLCPAEKTT